MVEDYDTRRMTKQAGLDGTSWSGCTNSDGWLKGNAERIAAQRKKEEASNSFCSSNSCEAFAHSGEGGLFIIYIILFFLALPILYFPLLGIIYPAKIVGHTFHEYLSSLNSRFSFEISGYFLNLLSIVLAIVTAALSLGAVAFIYISLFCFLKSLPKTLRVLASFSYGFTSAYLSQRYAAYLPFPGGDGLPIIFKGLININILSSAYGIITVICFFAIGGYKNLTSGRERKAAMLWKKIILPLAALVLAKFLFIDGVWTQLRNWKISEYDEKYNPGIVILKGKVDLKIKDLSSFTKLKNGVLSARCPQKVGDEVKLTLPCWVKSGTDGHLVFALSGTPGVIAQYSTDGMITEIKVNGESFFYKEKFREPFLSPTYFKMKDSYKIQNDKVFISDDGHFMGPTKETANLAQKLFEDELRREGKDPNLIIWR
ncbi:hypothetical protein [Solidesulfovibrio alcoholivorans]|uniref:hypothetical protein n=1 Tax=Solidesulfovibrio alcoholivorans TaxID=81406 RepID=UPI000A3F0B16|nr:hypothetical protein [Solidesulfovibrio alcoholivorans]